MKSGPDAISIHVPKLGRDMMLRPLKNTSEDRQRVDAAYRALPQSARMNRFWSNNASLSEKMIDRLLDADQKNHVVWAMLDPQDPTIPGVGAASFWRDPEHPTTAEFSVTIGQSYQRHSIATLLLALLWLIARQHGIESFFGHVRTDNRPALLWLGKVGVDVNVSSGDALLTWPLRSPDEIDTINDPPPLLPQIADWQRQLAPLIDLKLH